MSATVNPEISALREKVETLSKEVSEFRGGQQQIDKIIRVTAHQSIWQLIALIVSLCFAIVGGLAYLTNTVDKRIDQVDRRIDQLEKRMDQRIDQVEKRIDQSEKNITARFEDLKQEVRAQRK